MIEFTEVRLSGYQSRKRTNICELGKKWLAMENNQHNDIIQEGTSDILILDYENKMQIHGKSC